MQEHKGDDSALPWQSKIGRKYGKECKECVKGAAPSQGIYLWGYFESNGLWKNVYLGKAGRGKTTNLRARILEELKDDRRFAWSHVWGEADLRSRVMKIYARRRDTVGRNFELALKRRGARRIVWAAAPNLDNKSLVRVESDLIEAINPSANQQRPSPSSTWQEDTNQIFGRLRRVIHEARHARSAPHSVGGGASRHGRV